MFPEKECSVGGVLKESGPLPEHNLVLGIAEDGMPVLFDLEDAYPSIPVLFSGEPEHTALFLASVRRFALAQGFSVEEKDGILTIADGEYRGTFRNAKNGKIHVSGNDTFEYIGLDDETNTAWFPEK